MKAIYLIIILPVMLIASLCSAQNDKTAKLIDGTWQLDSLYIGGQELPEPLLRKVYEKMNETKQYTTYYFGEDGKYINTTKVKTTEGRWELSQTGDTLTLILPDKTIINKILHISEDSLAIEPQDETKEVENGKIFMVRQTAP
ncbi:MAG: lipocalin family protein [Bacteroidales bacterium]|nr:lipocalin family protein [Bacteroidales bacterium]